MNFVSTAFFPCQIPKNDLGRFPFSPGHSRTLLDTSTLSNSVMNKRASTWGIFLHLISCQLTPVSHHWFEYWGEGGPNKKNNLLSFPFLVLILLMFDMGCTQSIRISLAKQQATQEARNAFSTALACVAHGPKCLRGVLASQYGWTTAMVLRDCLCHSMGHPRTQSLSSLFALTWVLHRVKSLRSVPALTWVTHSWSHSEASLTQYGSRFPKDVQLCP